jgi:DNA-binding ferritin-like protein
MRSLEELCCYMISLLRSVAMVERNSHWLVKGSYGDHLMYERAYVSAAADEDSLAERCVGLFGAEVLNLKLQAQLIEKFLSGCTSDNPLDNSIKIEEEFVKANKLFVAKLEKEGKMTLGLEDLLPELSARREESLYLLKQRRDEDTGASELSSERRARLKLLKRIKNAAPQDDPNQVLHQKLLTALQAIVLSYVQGTYDQNAITVSVDPATKKIQGFAKLPKVIPPEMQKKMEDNFTANAVKLLGGNPEQFSIGLGFWMPPETHK